MEKCRRLKKLTIPWNLSESIDGIDLSKLRNIGLPKDMIPAGFYSSEKERAYVYLFESNEFEIVNDLFEPIEFEDSDIIIELLK